MTIYPTLLEQFLREECTPHVRDLICAAKASPKVRHELEFNRFNLTLDIEEGRATITDELDASAAGSVDVGLDDFLTAVGCAAQPSGRRGPEHG